MKPVAVIAHTKKTLGGGLGDLRRLLDEHEITRVVHLAALQVPFVRANPPLGMRVNVAGTVNVLEAVASRLDPDLVTTLTTPEG